MHGDDRRALAGAFQTLAEQLLKHHGFSAKELTGLIPKGPVEGIPATAFATELTPLETVVRYYEDTPEEWTRLGRGRGALRQALANGMRKHPGPLPVTPTPHRIPIEVFADRRYSALENLCLELKRQGLGNTEIAALIGKDPRTVWTVLSRAGKKGGARDA